MYPEDRVLVGVVNRARDAESLLRDLWYRIPLWRMPNGFGAEYLALFFSGQAARPYSASGIYYFGRLRGIELHLRRHLLPQEVDHPRANEAYYRLHLEVLLRRTPPILNRLGRRVSFIWTTGERFLAAEDISELVRPRCSSQPQRETYEPID